MSAPGSDTAAIRQTIRALRKADHVITSVNNGAEYTAFAPDASEDAIIDEATATDGATMHVRLPDGARSFVLFVLGNAPYEVICDHGVSLSPVLDPLTDGWEPED